MERFALHFLHSFYDFPQNEFLGGILKKIAQSQDGKNFMDLLFSVGEDISAESLILPHFSLRSRATQVDDLGRFCVVALTKMAQHLRYFSDRSAQGIAPSQLFEEYLMNHFAEWLEFVDPVHLRRVVVQHHLRKSLGNFFSEVKNLEHRMGSMQEFLISLKQKLESSEYERLALASDPNGVLFREWGLSVAPRNFRIHKRISYTYLQAYQQCPLKFYYRYILGLPRGNVAASSLKGEVFHDFAHQTIVASEHNVETSQTDSKQYAGTVSKTPRESPGDDSQTQETRKRPANREDVCAMVEQKYRSVLKKQGYTLDQEDVKIMVDYSERTQSAMASKELGIPKATELNFKVHFEGLELCGTYDQVWQGEDGVVIKELKSNRLRGTAEENLQLMIYVVTYEQAYKERPVRAVLENIRTGEQSHVVPDDDYVRRAKEKIMSVVNEIKKGVFTAKPGKICGSCPYSTICAAATQPGYGNRRY